MHGEVAVPPVTAAEDAAFHFRLNAGGGEFVDAGGNTWSADTYGRGGKRSKRVYDVGGTVDDPLFADCRTGRLIRYAIPVPAAGTYTVNLLFADPKNTTPGRRVLRVVAEDQPVLTDFDVVASGGARGAVARAFAVTTPDAVVNVVIQGTVGKALVSGIEVAQGGGELPLASAWQEAAPAPLPLFEAQGAAVGDKLFVFGGFYTEAIQAARAVNVYDPATNAWSARPDMPTAVSHAGVAADGATVWLVGGLSGDYNGGANPATAEVWKYDTAADVWTPGPALPAAGAAGGLALVGRRLHYFGGLAPDAQRDTAQHWVLNVDDPATGWQAAAPLPLARNHFGTAVVDGRIYAIGGQHERNETEANLRDVHVYTPSTNRWAAAARLPRPMSHFHPSTAVVNGRIVIAGGVTNGRAPLADVLEYDPATRRWSSLAPLPAPRKAPVMAAIAGRLIAVAGSPGDNFPQSTTWVRAV